MNWKKLLLIGLVASGFAFAAAPRSDAGVSVGIGFGFPGRITATTQDLRSIGPAAIESTTATIVTITTVGIIKLT